MATTPPSRSIIHTPPTPLHGAKFDNHRQSSTRKSTRQSARRSQRAIHTPPPASASASSSSQLIADTYSPPSSAHTSPHTRASKRRRGNPAEDIAQANFESSPASSFSMDPFIDSSDLPLSGQSAPNPAINMLPTPAKTPRKQDMRKTTELQSAARVLFPTRLEKVEDAMPTKKGRRGRKNVGFSLDSSGEDEQSTGRIQIFTDSKDKVPELDTGEDNPFLEKPDTTALPEPTKTTGRRGRRSQVKSNPHIEEAFNHEEGMVYVFRGKKIYRRFTPDSDQPNLSSEETEIEGSASPRLRPLTRSSVKPRLLFPTEKQRREREVAEEEALTDIEDGRLENGHEKLTTPVKQSFAPTTPPTTGHATRSTTKQAALRGGSSPLAPPEVSFEDAASSVERRPGKRTSPFNAWQRTKAGSDGHSKGKKRRADQMEEHVIGAGNKKTRPNTAT